MHSFDRLSKRNPARPLTDRQLANRFEIVRHPVRDRARIERNAGELELQVGKKVPHRADRRFKRWGVIRPVKRQGLAKDSLRFQIFYDPIDGVV